MNHMKNTLLTLITSLGVASLAFAAEKEDIHGPKGGELLDAKPHKAEFIVGKDHIATIGFYDEAIKPVPVTGQSAVIWAESKSGRVKVELEKKGDALVAITSLPEGEYMMMIQIKSAPDAKAQSFKIKPHHDEHGDEHKHGDNGKYYKSPNHADVEIFTREWLLSDTKFDVKHANDFTRTSLRALSRRRRRTGAA